MEDFEAIIVGGGPAGSTCAWKLKEAGVNCLILDKEEFPRTKLCAGWITPRVVRDLKLDIENALFGILPLNKVQFHVNIFGLDLSFRTRRRQYSIRRYEFDNWLLKRSGVEHRVHRAVNIRKDGDHYVIDEKYLCRYLIGAGGTGCPVYRTFFEKDNPRPKKSLIVTLEEEFAYDYQDKNCRLWLFDRGLAGYAWYVPKANGYLNVGIGGLAEQLKAKGQTIQEHWEYFVKKLAAMSLVKNYRFNPRGHVYYLRGSLKQGKIGNAFVVGDAAGLATKDLGEGIGPAVESALLAAEAIVKGREYSFSPITKYSTPPLFFGF